MSSSRFISSKTGDFDTGLREIQRGANLLFDSNNQDQHLHLNCIMAEIYVQRGNYEETVEIC